MMEAILHCITVDVFQQYDVHVVRRLNLWNEMMNCFEVLREKPAKYLASNFNILLKKLWKNLRMNWKKKIILIWHWNETLIIFFMLCAMMFQIEFFSHRYYDPTQTLWAPQQLLFNSTIVLVIHKKKNEYFRQILHVWDVWRKIHSA
jgi:hypothetical protein